MAYLLVLAETGSRVSVDEFNDWYDHEHVPLRLRHIKHFLSASRYTAIDSLSPTFLANYDIDSPDLFSNPIYTTLRQNRSPREADLISRLACLDRRSCIKLNESSPSSFKGKDAAPFLVLMSSSSLEDLPPLETIAGWRRSHQHRVFDSLVISCDADPILNAAPTYITLHEFDTDDLTRSDLLNVQAGKSQIQVRSFKLLTATDNTAPGTMTRIDYKSPEPGTSPAADAIRVRRGSRGLSPLDQALMNAPEIAMGWNSLLGAVRTRTSLADDVREIMILRVAARNSAAFEWLHHAHVGVDAGLTNEQLTVIRDLNTPLPLPTDPAPFTPIQAAALRFAEASTYNIIVPTKTVEDLKEHLLNDQQLLEAVAVPATYNMVSRLLVALDVGELGNEALPLPETNQSEHYVEVEGDVKLYVKVAKRILDGETAPWIICVNSLMSNEKMWEGVLPRLSKKYNLLTYDQRGHGRSTVPTSPTTLHQLSNDIATIISSLSLPTPIHSLIGVSLGGATLLAFAQSYPTLYSSLVICDTQTTAPANASELWQSRIEVARTQGMEGLSKITIPRWFPAQSEYLEGGRKESVVREMIERTPIQGFEVCCGALKQYDLREGLGDAMKGKQVLFVAGERDGVLPAGLKALTEELSGEGVDAKYEEIKGCGHLPMVDGTRDFLDVVEKFWA